MIRRFALGFFKISIRKNRMADENAFITDVGARESAGGFAISLLTSSCDFWQNEQRGFASELVAMQTEYPVWDVRRHEGNTPDRELGFARLSLISVFACFPDKSHSR